MKAGYGGPISGINTLKIHSSNHINRSLLVMNQEYYLLVSKNTCQRHIYKVPGTDCVYLNRAPGAHGAPLPSRSCSENIASHETLVNIGPVNKRVVAVETWINYFDRFVGSLWHESNFLTRVVNKLTRYHWLHCMCQFCMSWNMIHLVLNRRYGDPGSDIVYN